MSFETVDYMPSLASSASFREINGATTSGLLSLNVSSFPVPAPTYVCESMSAAMMASLK